MWPIDEYFPATRATREREIAKHVHGRMASQPVRQAPVDQGPRVWPWRVKPGMEEAFHDFLAAYLRFVLQLAAYVYLVTDKYPSLIGKPGYPVDVTVDPPARQGRLTALVRLVLAFPALMLAYAIPGGTIGWGSLIPLYAGAVIAGTITAPVFFA